MTVLANEDDSGIQLEDEIDEEHPSGMCPLCDNAVMAFEPFTTVVAHGNRYLVHASCLEALTMGDDEKEATIVAPARGQG